MCWVACSLFNSPRRHEPKIGMTGFESEIQIEYSSNINQAYCYRAIFLQADHIHMHVIQR
jgi:hypothetical protein